MIKQSIVLLLVLTSINAFAQEFGQFTDSRDGKTYKTVKIGEQVWMAENLAFKADSGCWAYENKQSNTEKYGYLYNWETAQKVCPIGWQLPTKIDFETFLNKYGESSSFNLNYEPFIPGGESGFLVLFGGIRSSLGNYHNIGVCAYFLASSLTVGADGWILVISSGSKSTSMGRSNKSMGFSLRCVQN